MILAISAMSPTWQAIVFGASIVAAILFVVFGRVPWAVVAWCLFVGVFFWQAAAAAH